MRLLDIDTVIDQYYEIVKNKYPNIDKIEFIKICKNPFHFIANQMARPDMPVILIKYFGKFVVLSTRIKYIIIDNNNRLRNGWRSPEVHARKDVEYKRILNIVLNDEQKQDMEVTTREQDSNE